MLKKRLAFVSAVVRSGAARLRSRAASRRSSVNGPAVRTNGRISSRSTGVVSSKNGVSAALVAGRARTGSRSDSSAELSSGAKSRTSVTARSVARSAPGSRATAVEMLASSPASVSKTEFEALTSRVRSSGRRPSSATSRP
jgi:hypothetical protein